MIPVEQIAAYRPTLLRIVISMVRNIPDAEDVVSSAVAKAINKYSQFRGEAKLETWLTSIARREAFMYWRTLKKKARAAEVPLEEGLTVCTESDAVLIQLMHRQRLDICIDVIARMPPTMKEAMIVFMDCDGDQVWAAEVVGVSLNTFKSRMWRARKRLHEVLDERPN